MRRQYYKLILLSIVLLPSLLSCLRDKHPQCGPLTVSLGIEDRNYSNINYFEDMNEASATVAFNKYVSKLYLRLEDYKTGAEIETRTIIPTGDSPTFSVTFNDSIPYGRYVVTAWGNILHEPTLNSAGESCYRFDPEDGNEEDLFVVRDTVDYQPGTLNPEVMLRRVKGLLNIQTVNLPSYIRTAAVSATNVREEVTEDLDYSGSVTWRHTRSLSGTQPEGSIVYISVLIPPSTATDATEVITRYYADGSLIQLTPSAKVTINRNQITELKYEWNDDQNVTVYININGEWEKVVSLDVNEQ